MTASKAKMSYKAPLRLIAVCTHCPKSMGCVRKRERLLGRLLICVNHFVDTDYFFNFAAL